MKGAEKQHIILFDGVCNLCNSAINFVIRRDSKRKFKFASLQSPIGEKLLKESGLATDQYDSFVYLKNGKVLSKSTAALEVMKDLGGGWKLAYGFKIVPRPLRDAVYNFIAKTRYKVFGRRESCMMPTEDVKSRFMDI